MRVDGRQVSLVSALEVVTHVSISCLCVALLLPMLLKVLTLLTEQFLLIFLRADQKFLPDVFIEILVDYCVLSHHGLFSIYNLVLMRTLGQLGTIIGDFLLHSYVVEIFLQFSNSLFLVKLLDHGLQKVCLALLSEVKSVLINFDLPSHLDVFEAENFDTIISDLFVDIWAFHLSELAFLVTQTCNHMALTQEHFLALINLSDIDAATIIVLMALRRHPNITAILHYAHHSYLRLLHTLALSCLVCHVLPISRVHLLGEVGSHAQVVWLMALVEDKFVDFEGNDDDSHEHAGDC